MQDHVGGKKWAADRTTGGEVATTRITVVLAPVIPCRSGHLCRSSIERVTLTSRGGE
jgi:hypothetical protein